MNAKHADDRGNIAASTVFVVVVALIIAALSTAIITAGRNVADARQASQKINEQVAAADARYLSLLSSAQPSGSLSFDDAGRINTYKVSATNTLFGFDTAGQPVWAEKELNENYNFTSLANAEKLYCGLQNTDVYCWGEALRGEAGNGTAIFRENKPTKTATGGGHQGFTQLFGTPHGLCGIEKTTTALWCWGSNTHRTFGASDVAHTPVKVTTAKVRPANPLLGGHIAWSANTFCIAVTTPSEQVLCNGALDGDSTTSNALKVMKSGATVIPAQAVSLTDNTLLVAAKGTTGLYGAALNAQGAQGYPAPLSTTLKGISNMPDVKFVSVSPTVNGDVAVAIQNGKTYVFGSTYRGDGTARQNIIDPVEVPLPDLPVLALVTPSGSICASTEVRGSSHRRVYCWGANTYGEVGNGTTSAALRPVRVDTDGEDRFFQMVNLSARSNMVCADSDNDIYCWGDNKGKISEYGSTSLTVPEKVISGVGLKVLTQSTLCYTGSAKSTACQGYNDAGSLGRGYDAHIIDSGTLQYPLPANTTKTVKRGG